MSNILQILANEWLKLKSHFVKSVDGNSLLALPEPSSNPGDPAGLLDELQTLVHKLRGELDLDVNKKWDLDILAASTYLYHIDRILMKVRENMVTYRYRLDQFEKDKAILKQNEFIYAQEAHAHCYIAILNLTTVLKKSSLKQIYNDQVVNPIHALELESANLNSAIRALNQLSFRQETLLQLNMLEQSLMTTLSNPPPDFVYTNQGVMYSTTEYLRNQLKEVALPEDLKWLSTFVETQDMLKKCYVVARKGVINGLLDKMSDHIQALITSFNRKNPDEEKIFFHLTAVFNSIESIRFNCHRENGCSKHLFTKANEARKDLRKACQQHPLGRVYLERMTIKREPLKVKSIR